MTDAELHTWWPELGAVVDALRRADHSAVADRLLEAVGTASSSSEILGDVGVVLRDHRALRSRIGDSGARAWDAVMADVYRAYPGSRLVDWFRGWTGR